MVVGALKIRSHSEKTRFVVKITVRRSYRSAERYEVGSILLTSNRAPKEWPELFGNRLLASAGLDRLAHRAETLVITGSSYRTQGRVRFEQEVAQAGGEGQSDRMTAEVGKRRHRHPAQCWYPLAANGWYISASNAGTLTAAT